MKAQVVEMPREIQIERVKRSVLADAKLLAEHDYTVAHLLVLLGDADVREAIGEMSVAEFLRQVTPRSASRAPGCTQDKLTEAEKKQFATKVFDLMRSKPGEWFNIRQLKDATGHRRGGPWLRPILQGEVTTLVELVGLKLEMRGETRDSGDDYRVVE